MADPSVSAKMVVFMIIVSFYGRYFKEINAFVDQNTAGVDVF
jgi:hypothetical protein